MKHFVQTGRYRTLQCSNEKFVVDFAQGMGVVRQFWHSQQSKSFYDDLCGQMVTQFQDSQRGFTPDTTTAIAWLSEFMTHLEPGYLATKLVHERLMQIEQTAISAGGDEVDEHSQRNKLRAQLAFKMEQVENRLQTVNLMESARLHYEQVLTRWNRGQYLPFSPAGRCYAALQELYWGAFGEAILLCDSVQKTRLIEDVRIGFIDKLASEVDASPHTRHYYHQWLTPPFSSGVLEYKEALAWLGNNCHIEQQPVSYSVTQAWRGIALGMPRICSATRLGSALVDELLV